MTSLREEFELAIDLAQRCGALALSLQRGGADALKTREKHDDQGPVTVADTEVNRMIVEALRERFPDDAVLAEESADRGDRLSKPRCWIIDPIDGTRDFAQGDDHWAIHIGLCVEGQPRLGVVGEPATGIISCGLCLEDAREAWSIDAEGRRAELDPHDARRRLVTSRSHHSDRVFEAARTLGIDSSMHERFGSVGCKSAALARGEAQLYVHPVSGTKLWDSCAPEALVAACGGQMTDVFGDPLRYDTDDIVNRKGLLATVGGVHDDTLEKLAPLVRQWFA